jgi:methylenetetrahydrofolate reductase (NADPH)
MDLASHYADGRFGLSFEFFPPKTDKGLENLWGHVRKLMAFKPAFMTCTYGAGGSTRDKTLEIAARIHADHGIPVAAHLTCVGATVGDLRRYLEDARKKDIAYIVALRGDPPKGEAKFVQVEGGLRYANELVALIRAEFPDFGVAVAGYPETHQEAVNSDVDLENLKRKVDAGADVVITQLFYTNEDFYRFRDRYDAAGIAVPLVPGMLPVTSSGQLERVVANCGAILPPALHAKLVGAADDDAAAEIGIAHTTAQCAELLTSDIPGMHFYVLNKSQVTGEILGRLTLPNA